MTQPSPHLDLDALADALAGQSDPAETAHLAGCPSCTSRLAELQAAEVHVVAALAVLPAPPVPADLADRLSAALAAQDPLSGPPSSVRSTSASVRSLPRPAPRRRSWLPVAAAGVLLLSGAGIGLSLLGGADDGTGGGDVASTAAGAVPESGPADVDLRLTASGADWAEPAATATALPEVLGGDAEQVRLAPPGTAEAGGGQVGQAEDAAELEAEAGAEAEALDAGTAEDAAGAELSGSSAAELDRLRTPEGLASCLSALLPADEPDLLPLAVDYARYDGQPALAVVLPDPDPTQVSIFVVGAGCSAQDERLLHFVRAPRP